MSYICLNKYLAWSFRNRTGLHEIVASQVHVLSLHCSGHQKPWGWGDGMLCSQLQDVQCLPVLCNIERTVDSSQLCYFCKMLKYLADSNPKSKANASPAKIVISCYFQKNIFKITFLEDSVTVSMVRDLFVSIYIPKPDLLLLVQPNPDLDCLSDMHWLASWSIRLKCLFLTFLQENALKAVINVLCFRLKMIPFLHADKQFPRQLTKKNYIQRYCWRLLISLRWSYFLLSSQNLI